ncbi:MAG: acyltransferase family protein [Janibacter sp.]
MTSTDTKTRSGVVRPKGYRPDIEGMRSIAILLVLLYHAGLPFISGGFVGVDVFFVISGFLITGLLIRELETKGKVSLTRFYARRAKRLLPATGLVLIVTTVLTWVTANVVEWRTFGFDIVGAALYVVNWVLAGRAVDYLAEDVGVSPVQHFWSLAVEEQFYIVWPLLLILVGWWVARRRGARVRPVMLVGILVVIIPSFLWSIHMTGADPERAFFVTTTRLWELGIGAFVAIGSVLWVRIPRIAAIVLGWVGLAAIVLSGFLLTSGTPWPGYAALLPTLGSAAVIVAGFTSGSAGPAGILAWRPAVWLGGLSYSLYLWHWPLIVSAEAHWDGLSPWQGLAVAVFAVVPAYLSYRFIENPIRFSPTFSRSNLRTLSMGAAFSATGVAAGLVLVLAVPGTPAPADDGEAKGAAALTSEAKGDGPRPGTVESLDSVEGFVPTAIEAVEDIPPQPEKDGCQVDQVSPKPIRCEYGDPDGDTTIVTVGDSKILQWQTVLDEIAKKEGWHVISYTKSACAFSSGMQLAKGDLYTSCAEWNDSVMDKVVDVDPDLVIATSRVNSALEDTSDKESLSNDAMVTGLTESWQELKDHDIPVLGLLDNPSPGISVYECVAEHPDDLAECSFDREEGIESSSAKQYQAAAKKVPGTRTVDVRDSICPEETCVPVIGDVLVYRQSSHITDTYAQSAKPVLEKKLVPAVEEMIG